MFIFAAISTILGLNAISQVESMDIPEVFAFIPLGIAILLVSVALCILAGIYTPKTRKGVYMRPIHIS
jgi:hypothetical protein